MQSSFENQPPLENQPPSADADRAPGRGTGSEAELRSQAVENLHARRGFVVQVLVYLLINAILFWSWAQGGFGFPWPLFVLVFWGIGLFWQAWSLFGPGDSEDRIRKEMDRLRGHS